MTQKTLAFEELKAIFDAAVADVSALKIGSEFLGVMPMAEARGYKRGTPEYGLYIMVAVDALPTAVYVDEKTNLITQMSEPNCLTWKGR